MGQEQKGKDHKTLETSKTEQYNIIFVDLTFIINRDLTKTNSLVGIGAQVSLINKSLLHSRSVTTPIILGQLKLSQRVHAEEIGGKVLVSIGAKKSRKRVMAKEN
jgi:hypothetical protein